jgi:DUF4097 and DUF4098 domain-containing protein YvlB
MQEPVPPSPLRLTIAARSGSIRLRSGPGSTVEAPGARVHTEADGSVRIDSPSRNLEVTCPEGADVILGTASGKVRLTGRFGDVRVTSASGSVKVEAVASLDVRLRSGSVSVESCIGDCHVVSTSGRIEIERAGRVDVGGKSGSITVGACAGGRVHTTSGHIEVGLDRAADLEVRAVSSSIEVDVPMGVKPALDLHTKTGHVHADVTQGDDCRIMVHTVSGAIRVR